MGKPVWVICSGCGARLLNSAVCVNCKNVKEEKAYQELYRDIVAIVEGGELFILRKIKKRHEKLMKSGRKKKKASYRKQ